MNRWCFKNNNAQCKLEHKHLCGFFQTRTGGRNLIGLFSHIPIIEGVAPLPINRAMCARTSLSLPGRFVISKAESRELMKGMT